MTAPLDDQDRNWPQSSQTFAGAPPVAATVKMVHVERSPGHVVYATREPARFTTTLMVRGSPFTLASQVCFPLDKSRQPDVPLPKFL